jgi:hypothetical protein
LSSPFHDIPASIREWYDFSDVSKKEQPRLSGETRSCIIL